MAGSSETEDYNAAGNTDSSRRTVMLLGGWPTPRAEDSESTGAHRGAADTLTSATRLAGWPSLNVPNGGRQAGLDSMSSTGKKRNGRKGQVDLNFTAAMAGWPMPQARDSKGGYKGGRVRKGNLSTDTLDVAAQVSGPTTPSSPAPTGKRGALNPALPRWLMGFPAEWLSCVDWATLSARKSRRRL